MRQGGAAGLALPFHGVAGFQELVKGLSADILHDQGAVVVREGEAVEESDDVWMVDGAVVNLPLKRFLIRAVPPPSFQTFMATLECSANICCERYIVPWPPAPMRPSILYPAFAQISLDSPEALLPRI